MDKCRLPGAARLRLMKYGKTIAFGLGVLISAFAGAHHSVPAEYGDSGTPTHYIEGTITGVMWANPHIFINLVSSGGEVPAGENWRLTTHPINVMTETYGFENDDFAEGDTVRVHGWFHLRGQPLFQIRAISVNEGPMLSTLRFSDLRDIVNGSLAAKQIVPTTHINGTSPGRAGVETVRKLGEMGYLDEDGNVRLPDRILHPDYAPVENE